MVDANSTIAVIPSSHFKWTAQIQLKETLSTRDEAIRFASQHGCNLIVMYEKRSGPKFDVLQDPNLVCTSGVDCELVEAVPVSKEAESSGWSKLTLRDVFGFARRLGAAASTSHQENAIPPAHRQALVVK